MEIPFTDTGNKEEELAMRRKGSSAVGEEVWNCLWNVQAELSHIQRGELCAYRWRHANEDQPRTAPTRATEKTGCWQSSTMARTASGRKPQRSRLIGEKAEAPTSRKPKEERILRTKGVNGIRGLERSNNPGKTLTRPEKCLLDLAKWNSLVTSGGRRTPDCKGVKDCGLFF